MLAADFVGELRFRLAGTRVCALFGREVKSDSFCSFWSEASRRQIDPLLKIVADENVGAVAALIGSTADGTEADVEMLLLPLAHSGQARIRALGVLAPVAVPFEKPVIELGLRTLRHIGGAASQDGRLPAGARRNGFVVYRGGREAPGERTG